VLEHHLGVLSLQVSIHAALAFPNLVEVERIRPAVSKVKRRLKEKKREERDGGWRTQMTWIRVPSRLLQAKIRVKAYYLLERSSILVVRSTDVTKHAWEAGTFAPAPPPREGQEGQGPCSTSDDRNHGRNSVRSPMQDLFIDVSLSKSVIPRNHDHLGLESDCCAVVVQNRVPFQASSPSPDDMSHCGSFWPNQIRIPIQNGPTQACGYNLASLKRGTMVPSTPTDIILHYRSIWHGLVAQWPRVSFRC
jgi:hypothetical protein